MESDVLEALKKVTDPELHVDVVTLKMIKDVVIENDKVGFTLELTTPACPFNSQIEADVRKAVESLPGVKKVDMKTTARVWTGRPQLTEDILSGVKNIIAVASGKGGVGKSTVAANIAIALAEMGSQVGLLDADIYGPSVPKVLNILVKPIPDAGRKIVPAQTYLGVRVMSLGLFVTDDTAMIWRGPMVAQAIKQLLTEANWGELDYLIVDLPPGCVTADTLVHTNPGVKPISELKPGQTVYSFEGHLERSGHKRSWTLNASLAKRGIIDVIPQGMATVYELRTATRSIRATGNHPILALIRESRQGSRYYNYKLKWIPLAEMKLGDIVAVVKRLPEEAHDPDQTPEPLHRLRSMTKGCGTELARLIGYFIGDGYVKFNVNNRNYSVWFYEPRGGKYREQYIRWISELFPSIKIYEERTRFALISKKIAELFRELDVGSNARTKKIPDWAFRLPISERIALIHGYCDADGHRRKVEPGRRRIEWMTFESTNENLIKQARALAISAGLKVSNLRKRSKKVVLPSTAREVFSESWLFEAGIGGKTSLYGARVIRGPTVHGLRHPLLGFERVRRLTKLGLQEVYDLQVEESGNFLAEGLVVHNTGDASLTIAQTIPVTGVVIVSTPQVAAVNIAGKALRMFRRLDIPIVGIVENMSYGTCPHCGHKLDVFGAGGAKEAAKQMQSYFLGEIPLNTDVRIHGDEGRPVIVANPKSPSAEAFRALGRTVAGRVSVIAHARLTGKASALV